MSSETLNHLCTKETEVTVLETRSWTHIVAILESVAPGKNEFGYGGSFVEIEPGTTINHWVAPNTKINIKSTSLSGARWSIAVTELNFIDDVLSALCAGGN